MITLVDNTKVRRLHYVVPNNCGPEVADAIAKEQAKGTYFAFLESGSAANRSKEWKTHSYRVILIAEERADAFIRALEAACAPKPQVAA